MTVYTHVEFTCDTCQADILYEDEIPEINIDRQSIARNNKAEKFMRAHQLKYTYEEYATLLPTIPPLVHWYQDLPNVSIGFQPSYLQTKYTICPICGARIYL